MSPKDVLALFALAAIWGGSFLFIRIAVPALGPIALVAGRVVLAVLVLWAGLRLAGKRAELRGRWRHLLALGAVNGAIPFTMIAAAELHLTASLASLINATTPLFAALLAALVLGEPITRRRGVGLVLGLVGVAVLVGWSPVEPSLATTLSIGAMLVASAGYGRAGVYTRRFLRDVPPASIALGQQVGALAWLAIPAMFARPALPLPAAAVWSLLALGVVSTAFAYLLYFRLIERVGPTRTSTVTFLVPVFGMTWGVLFLGERVTAGMLAGFALVLGSLMLVNGVRLPVGRWWRARRSDSSVPCLDASS